MATTITILCENRASEMMGITGEHGFSALIETDDNTVLLDTGQGLTLAGNARVLGKNLGDIDMVTLSHGHVDHTGGLGLLRFPGRKVPVVAHPDIFTEKYAQVRQNPTAGIHFHIGIRENRAYLENLGLSFQLKRDYEEILPGIFFSGEVSRKTEYEKPDTFLKIKTGNTFIQDPLLDDTSLLIETDAGPVIVSGCAHSGIVNVMEHFREKSGHDRFHAVIGGTHLGFLGPGEQLDRTLEAFDRFKVNLIAVSHCTGNVAAAVCHRHFKERFAFANAGWEITF